jgi:hypothetical protein
VTPLFRRRTFWYGAPRDAHAARVLVIRTMRGVWGEFWCVSGALHAGEG